MLHQSQLQKQTFKILPQQIQMLGIYHLNTIQLEQRIKDELDENPLLETTSEDDHLENAGAEKDQPQDYQDWEEYGYDDIPDYKIENESFIHSNNMNIPMRDFVDFRSSLKQQLINLDLKEDQLVVAEYIIDCLEDNGFLERSLDEIADDISFSQKIFAEPRIVEEVLLRIQELEPFGVGSRNIREFLLRQLAHQKQCPVVKKSTELIDKYYHELQKRNFDKIYNGLGIDEDELPVILKHISTLQLKPINESHEGLVKETIIPDFILTVEGETVMVDLFRQRSQNLFINESLMSSVETAEGRSSEEKSTLQYLKSKLSSAIWFVNAIKQREDNMLRIIKSIIKKQKQYFLTGDVSNIKPMILKNIADEVGLDISTISRVTCNKYIDTPFGYILLKNLFTEGIINEDGTAVSNKVVQIKLKEIIDVEDKDNPYNDQQLVALLHENGIKIARRTVAKYRDIMNIPVGDMRRLWAKTV